MALNFELVVSDQLLSIVLAAYVQVIQNKRPWCSAAAYVTAGWGRLNLFYERASNSVGSTLISIYYLNFIEKKVPVLTLLTS